jgi:hypothetical protein
MATTTIHNVQDLVPVLRRMEKFTLQTQRLFRAAMEESVLELERAVVERTPTGVGDSATGHLRGSVFSEVRGQEVNLFGIVASSALYAPAVEYGSRPHWPPKGALNSWVHLIMGVPEAEVPRVEYLVRRAISRRGTRARHMFEQGWHAALPQIRMAFLKAFSDAAKEIGRGG